MIACSDTETTGFVKNGPWIQEGQARIVQLAMLVCNDQGEELDAFETLIKPDGWTINPGAQVIHGITMEKCHDLGVPIIEALDRINAMMAMSDILVFHNEGFDWKLFNVEYAYANMALPKIKRYCTMLGSMDICGIPGKYGKPKWPKLAEALPILCGKEMSKDAHDAMVDTRACKEIFFELKNRGIVNYDRRAA